MTVLQMTPDDIYKIFITRITKTNSLFDSLSKKSEMELELANTLYFKYYFDISTAIEATIRGITFVEGEKHKYIAHIAKPGDDCIAYFKDYEEVKSLCGLDNLFKNLEKQKFENNFFNKIAVLKGHAVSVSCVNDGSFSDLYKYVRKTRNALAHGLKADSIEYDYKTIESFLYVFFILHSYYSKICFPKELEHK